MNEIETVWVVEIQDRTGKNILENKNIAYKDYRSAYDVIKYNIGLIEDTGNVKKIELPRYNKDYELNLDNILIIKMTKFDIVNTGKELEKRKVNSELLKAKYESNIDIVLECERFTLLLIGFIVASNIIGFIWMICIAKYNTLQLWTTVALVDGILAYIFVRVVQTWYEYTGKISIRIL